MIEAHSRVEAVFQSLLPNQMAKVLSSCLALPLPKFLDAALTNRPKDNLLTKQLETYRRQ
jgi:hypothetical protein